MDRFWPYLPHTKLILSLLASAGGPVFGDLGLRFWGRLSKRRGLAVLVKCLSLPPRFDGPMCWLAWLVGWTLGGWV